MTPATTTLADSLRQLDLMHGVAYLASDELHPGAPQALRDQRRAQVTRLANIRVFVRRLVESGHRGEAQQYLRLRLGL